MHYESLPDLVPVSSLLTVLSFCLFEVKCLSVVFNIFLEILLQNADNILPKAMKDLSLSVLFFLSSSLSVLSDLPSLETTLNFNTFLTENKLVC